MILITGCSGYIGSQLSYILNKYKYEFIGLDNLKYSYKKNFKFNKRFYKLDFSNKSVSNLIKNQKVITVIHCAAYSYVMDGEKNKKKYIKNNVDNTKKFLDLCKNNGVKNIIFLSSSNVYKDFSRKVSENHKKLPKNIYGKNKLDIENYLKKLNFKNYTILRLFNVVGLIRKFYVFNFHKKNHQRLFFKIIEKSQTFNLRYFIKNNRKIYPKRDFIDIRDLNTLILKILNKSKKERINKIFNVGSGKATSIKNIYNYFNKKRKNIKKFHPIKINNSELENTKASISLVKKYFKWSPKYSFKSSVISTLKYTVIN